MRTLTETTKRDGLRALSNWLPPDRDRNWRMTTSSEPAATQPMGNQATQNLLQAKLKISQPGDRYEQEADRVAESVMRMSDPGSLSRIEVGGDTPGPRVQRLCTKCQDDADEPKEVTGPNVQLKAEDEDAPSEPGHEGGETVTAADVEKETGAVTETMESNPSEGTEESTGAEAEEEQEVPTAMTKKMPGRSHGAGAANVTKVERGGGTPLDSATRHRFERHFERDFSTVRLHTDSSANNFAENLGALAATVGNNIYFAKGAERRGGLRLLAHEMTHVVQQNSVPALMRRPQNVMAAPIAGDLETEAERSAAAFTRDQPFTVSQYHHRAPQLYQSSICTGEANAHHSTQPRDFPLTYIQDINVSLRNQQVTLRWAGPLSARQRTGPFNCSTGAGVCGQPTCNDEAHSRTSTSCCTPKGSFPVLGFDCVTNRLNLHNFVNFQRDGVGLHRFGLGRRPGSHGCVRLSERNSRTIFDSSRRGVTQVNVVGNARIRCRYDQCDEPSHVQCPCPGSRGAGTTAPTESPTPTRASDLIS